MPRLYCAPAVFLLLVTTVALPSMAAADGGSELRRAGSEAQFRVIDRFPSQDRGSVDIPTVSPDDPFFPVIEEVLQQNWSAALGLLADDELQTALADRPAKRFLTGYIALEADHPEEALNHFDELGDELPALSDYRAYFAAKAAFAADDAHRTTLEAASVSSDSRLYDNALFLLARALDKAGETEDRRRSVEVLQLYLSKYSSRNDGPRVRLMLGEILESLERTEDAARVYLELRDEHPLRSEANSAVERLETLFDDLNEDLRGEITEDTTERTMRRFRGLFDLHRSETVVNELSDIVDDFPAGSSERCESLFLIARSYTKMRHHGTGTPWYDRVLDECAETQWEIRSLYLGGRGRWNTGDRMGAMEIFERIWTEYPDHSFADDAMYFSGRILRSEDRHDEAREILELQVETYPDGDMAKDAHWLLVRHLFDTEDYDEVVDYIDGLESTGEDDLYTRGRLHYFRGRALELNGQHAAAEEALSAVVRNYPKTYYALLAFNRLARVSNGDDENVCDAIGALCDELLPTSRTAEAIEVPDRLRQDSAFARGTTLLSIGLTSHARAEFSQLRNAHASDSGTLWALAMLLDRADAFPISHDIARRHIDGWMNEYPTESTRARWEVAYPTPFKEEVTRYATQRGLDAAMIYAIMREESGFNPQVESWANARGLLQLIEGTADRMAERVELSPYSFGRLLEPEVNVNLGSAYMDYLGERHNHHPALIMGAYNGGSTVVTRWLNEFGDLSLDLWVEDVPYGQTRNYIKRVMMSYWIYSYLYGDERVPRVAFELQ